MKREITFRAWDNIKKRWLTDFDTAYLSDEGYCSTQKTTNYNGDYLSKEDVEINFFTGLKDKNQKMIYEGDILKTGYGKVGEVVYHDERASFILHDPDHFNVQLFNEMPFIEIIGNIYQNSELLNKKQDEAQDNK